MFRNANPIMIFPEVSRNNTHGAHEIPVRAVLLGASAENPVLSQATVVISYPVGRLLSKSFLMFQ
jgi:hypothetical protein